jgi:beta-phosphoglucomutase-like phosphatase (HAD superfamily)
MTVTGRALRDRRLWLFDLDGTLVDSTPAHVLAFRAVLREIAPVVAAGFRYADHAGLSTRAVAHALGLRPDLVEPFIAGKQAHYRRLVDRGTVTRFPGVTEVLDRLTGLGATCRIATSASRESAERVLAATGLRGYFESVHTADDVPAGKPDPAVYRLALGSDNAADAVAVEDSVAGVRSASGAGVLPLRIHTIEPACAAMAVPTFAALTDALTSGGPLAAAGSR